MRAAVGADDRQQRCHRRGAERPAGEAIGDQARHRVRPMLDRCSRCRRRQLGRKRRSPGPNPLGIAPVTTVRLRHGTRREAVARASAPPNVTCPFRANPLGKRRDLTGGGMAVRSADSSSGPLEKNHTGTFRNCATWRVTKRRTPRGQQLAYKAPPTTTASKVPSPSTSCEGTATTSKPCAVSASRKTPPMPAVPSRFDPHVISTRTPIHWSRKRASRVGLDADRDRYVR